MMAIPVNLNTAERPGSTGKRNNDPEAHSPELECSKKNRNSIYLKVRKNRELTVESIFKLLCRQAPVFIFTQYNLNFFKG